MSKFSRGIGGVDGRDIYDRTLFHEGTKLLSEEEHASGVHVKHAVPVFRRYLIHVLCGIDPCVVYKAVDSESNTCDLLDKRIYGIKTSGIKVHETEVPCGPLGFHFFSSLSRMIICHDHIGSAFDKNVGDGSAGSGQSACYYYCLTFKVKHVGILAHALNLPYYFLKQKQPPQDCFIWCDMRDSTPQPSHTIISICSPFRYIKHYSVKPLKRQGVLLFRIYSLIPVNGKNQA